jgi:anti-sigma-K factor RskA
MSGLDPTSPSELAAAYALGALSSEETRAFEAQLADSPELRREVSEYRELMGLWAEAESPRAPADLRARVLATTPRPTSAAPAPAAAPADIAPITPRRWAGFAGWLAFAASLIGVLGLGLQVHALRQELAQRDRALAERERAIATRDTALARRQATLDAVLAPDMERYRLSASADPKPSIDVYLDRARHRATLSARGLAPVPSEKAYQLWFIRPGQAPMPSITFRPGPDGRALLERVELPGGALQAAAVTVEPAGGSRTPTPPILLVGSLQKRS